MSSRQGRQAVLVWPLVGTRKRARGRPLDHRWCSSEKCPLVYVDTVRDTLLEARVMTHVKYACLSLMITAGLAALPAPAAAQAKPPARSIVKITGELYRAQNDNHYTVFLVTPQGIILSDPINRDFSRWLKGEMATRFKVPVRYVLYTHRDWDHATGGVVWADTAEFVAHRNMLTAL